MTSLEDFSRIILILGMCYLGAGIERGKGREV